MIFNYIFFLLVFVSNFLFAQGATWRVFNNDEIGIQSSSVMCIEEDKDYITWIGTSNEGIFKYSENTWTKFDTSNTPIPINSIWTVTVDSFNNKWFGTFGNTGGLIKYDNIEWKVYNIADYGLLGSSIFSITIDENNNLWMGTYWDGIAMFDTDTTWLIYNHNNSGLLQPQEEINCVAIDNLNNLWYGSDSWGGGKFDLNTNWEYFTDFNLFDEILLSIDIDKKGNAWYGGWNFVMKVDTNKNVTKYKYGDHARYFNLIADTNDMVWFTSEIFGFLQLDYSQDESWTKLFPIGYGLDTVGCQGLTKDHFGNFWIGYNNGDLAVYNPNGIVGITDVQDFKEEIPNSYSLKQNYPNPFNRSTIIKYSIPAGMQGIPSVGNDYIRSVQLKVYDALGREVATIVNKKQNPGYYEVLFDARNLPSGVYYYQLKVGNLSSNSENGFNETKKMLLLR